MITSIGSSILSSHLIFIWQSSCLSYSNLPSFQHSVLLSPFGSLLTVPNSSLNPFLTSILPSKLTNTQVANKLLPLHHPQASSFKPMHLRWDQPSHTSQYTISSVISTTTSLCRSFHWSLCRPPHHALQQSLHHSSFSHTLDFFSTTLILWIILHLEFHCGLYSELPVRPYYSPFAYTSNNVYLCTFTFYSCVK